MFQLVSERQCAKCKTIVKLQLSLAKIPQTPFLNSEVTGPILTADIHQIFTQCGGIIAM